MIEINWDPPARDLRYFAIGQLIAVAILTGMIGHHAGMWWPAMVLLPISCGVAAIGLLAPRRVRYCYVLWMAAVFPVGFLVSHALLAAIFVLVITPLGIVMRLFRSDPMQRKADREATTYWADREAVEDMRRYFRQY